MRPDCASRRFGAETGWAGSLAVEKSGRSKNLVVPCMSEAKSSGKNPRWTLCVVAVSEWHSAAATRASGIPELANRLAPVCRKS